MDDYPAEFSTTQLPEPVEHDDPLQYFCKLTFGQFFTLVVLLVMTLCSSFYLGARYGNQYLRMGETRTPQIAVTSAMQPGAANGAPLPEVVQEDERLKQLAREALQAQQRTKLEGQMQDMLAAPTPPRPTTTSIAPPPEDTQPTNMGAEHANTAPAVNNDPGPGTRDPGLIATNATNDDPGLGTRDPRPTAVSPESRVPGPGSPSPETRVPSPGSPMDGGLVKVKSAGGMQYSVQIGAYQDQREATYFVEEWKTKGYPAYMMVADLGDRGRWYRVRLGGFPTKGDAEQYLNDLKTKETVNGIVVYNEQ